VDRTDEKGETWSPFGMSEVRSWPESLVADCSMPALQPPERRGRHDMTVSKHCPAYFNVCIPIAGISGRANLRSAERHDMLVPSTRTQLGRRSFHVVDPTFWNALPSQLRSSSISRRQFRAGLKPISSRRPTDTSENFCGRAHYFTLHLHC